MCGIAGLWAPDLTATERLGLVRGMLERLARRGPDGAAISDLDGVALGITRLAIVAPHLPPRVFAATTGVRAVVNGEVYNHRALREQLLARGHGVPANPDTAIFPHLYAEQGPEFPRALDAMFAAALWDPGRAVLLLARDRAGEKPLYWCRVGQRVAFASEPGVLVALPWMSAEPNPPALGRYLVQGCFAGDDCAFRNVHAVAPGHTVQFNDRGEKAACWWRVADAFDATATSPGTDAEAVVRTRSILERSVLSRVPGDVSSGLFLSGGIDSGLVAALLARAGVHVPTFTLRIEGEGYDESLLAATTARHLGLEHHVWGFDLDQAEEALCFAATMDQPLGDPSVLPTWMLARHAASRVRVVLTGEGADELFAGYPTYLGHRWAALADRIPTPVASAACRWLARVRTSNHTSLPILIEKFLATQHLPALERHLAWFGTGIHSRALDMLSPAMRSRVTGEALRPRGDAGPPSLATFQRFDFEVYLGGGMLTKVDRSTMAHGLESRAPYLQPELIAWALALPEHMKLRGRSGKWVLKQIARELLPGEVVHRRKQGFSPPFSRWARGPWRQRLAGILSAERVERAGVLNPKTVRELFEQHATGAHERGRALWAVTSLQMWAEHWLVDGPQPLAATGGETAPESVEGFVAR
jgi:asparagine synthase (glutamine-hydrolysing)